MRPSEFICSDSFRHTVLKHHPSLEHHRTHARLFAWIGFGSWMSAPRGELMLPSGLLAKLEQREHLLRHGNYQGFKYLTSFRDEVMPITVRHHNSVFNECRTLFSADFVPAIRVAIEAERCGKFRGEERVYFLDGRPVDARRQTSMQENLRAEALALTEGAGCTDAVRLLHYLNSRAPHRYTKILKNIPVALDAATTLPEVSARRHAQNLLLAIERQPLPFYQPSPRGRTVRIFGYTESLLGLKKSVRHALTPDWIEMDLRNSQAAILATDWDIPSLREFLQQGDSLWDYLFAQLSLPKQESTKGVLKEAVYATAFGMDAVNVARRLSRAMRTRGLGKRFCAVPLMRDILEARARVMTQTAQAKGRYDIYGRWLGTHGYSIPSILAQCAQAAEMRLLAPVIDLAERHTGKSGFSIMIWQHDGFSFAAHKREDASHWATRLQSAVRANGIALGYDAHLVAAAS